MTTTRDAYNDAVAKLRAKEQQQEAKAKQLLALMTDNTIETNQED